MKKLIHIWPVLFLVLLTVIFFYPFIFKGLLPIPADILPGVYYPWHDIKYPDLPAGVPVKNALPSDIVSLTYPLRHLAINMIKSGDWPLWNPYILSGTPLLANFQSAVINPLNLLYFLPLKFFHVWSIQVLLQPLLAALFLYFFLRYQKLSTISSLYGSIVWGFGGFIAIWAGYNTVIHAILPLPLALLAIQKVSEKSIFGSLLSLTVFYSAGAGNPPMTIILLVTSAAYALWIYRLSWRPLLLLLLYVILGLGLSAPLLLTGFQTSETSIRDVDTIAFTSAIKFLPIFKLVTISAPDFFGHPSTLNQWSGSGLYDNLTMYLGAIPFMFFVASFFHFYLGERQKLIRFFWVLFFFSLLMAIKNPVSSFIGSLSSLGLSSMVMTRFTVLTGLSVAICSAVVFDEVLSGRSKFVNWRASLSLSIGTIIIFLLLSAGVSLLAKNALSELAFGGHQILIDLVSFARVATRNSVLPILLISSTFILMSLLLLWPSQAFRLGRWPRTTVILFIFLLTTFELFRFYHKYNTFTKAEYLYPETPITTYLKSQPGRFARELGEIIPSNTWMPYEIFSASGYDTLHSLRYNQFLSLLSGDHLTSTSSRYAEVKRFRNQLFDFLGIRNIVLLKRILGVPHPAGSLSGDFEPKNFPPVFESNKTIIISNPRAFDLVYSVPRVQVSKSIDETEKLLVNSDLHLTAVVEKDLVKPPTVKATISDLSIKPQTISLHTSATASAFIVTSTVFDPGWQLYIDDLPQDIYITNHAFIGFPIDSGQHDIRLTYWPSTLNTGLAMSAVSATVLILSLIYLSQWPKLRP